MLTNCYQILTILLHLFTTFGDQSIAIDFPHGNCKHTDSNYVRTMPSVLKRIEDRCDNEKPSAIYRSEVTKASSISHMSTSQPRNIKQIENFRHKVIQSKRISHDSLYNLAEIAEDMPCFVHSIRIHPSLVCVVGEKSLLNEFDRVLLLDSPSPQLISYDTTFQLGDFYVSSLCFRHTLFRESPVIPAMFLLHERKYEEHHKEFFTTCKNLVPSLNSTKHPFVTDEERAIVNSISIVLPNVPQLRCWNHIFRDIRRWLRAHGALSTDIAIYLEDVRDLFHLQSQREYLEVLAKMKSKWSAPFYDYYSKNIQPDIRCIARWSIEEFKVYNPYSGVTTNQAESLNTVLKNLQQWNESPHDCMVLALYYLQAYYKREIIRGIHGMGNFHLHSQFKEVSNSVPLVEVTVYTPEEIVQRIKASDLNVPFQQSENNSSTQVTTTTTTKPTSQTERARQIIAEKKISFNPDLKTFTILGSGDKPQAVKLFPKPTCTCPSTVQCYHILAAKLSLGMENFSQDTKPFNLTQLRKNARASTEKKSGRKRPRVLDLDVQPAPDAKREQVHDLDLQPALDKEQVHAQSVPGAKQEQDNLRFVHINYELTNCEMYSLCNAYIFKAIYMHIYLMHIYLAKIHTLEDVKLSTAHIIQ